jgi:AcrR family transcriptional regulator
MSSRAAAMEVTRERIVEAATDSFTTQWYDDVTMRAVADAAGVALQTVVNHFGTKEALFAEALERWGDRIEVTRFAVVPGDLDAAIATLVDDYERTGDAALRMLAVEERVAPVREPIARGREGHERWCERTFPGALRGLRGAARRRRLAQLVVATDVYAWKLLRRDKGLDRSQTITAVRELVRALHEPAEEERAR